jgi:nucleoside-diphosphate-sugar epimerase
MQKTKVLITGAGGFVGKYIARDLLALGNYEVFSFSRGKYKELEDMGVTQIRGDLQNLNDVIPALAGMDAVIHTASMVGMGSNYKAFYATNVTGTKNIIEACLKNKISKLVYTSTPSVAFGNKSLCGVGEETPIPKKHLSYYATTKAIAEKEVIKANDSRLSTIAIRPHLIFGPGDKNLIPKVVEASKQGRLKIIGDGENLVDVSYVENVSKVHVMALERLSPSSPIAGKAYFFGQGPVKLWDFTNDILKRSGLSPLTKKIPLKVAYNIGMVIEGIARVFSLFGIKIDNPPMTRFVALQLGTSHYFNHSQIEKDLGPLNLISIEEGLDRLFKK